MKNLDIYTWDFQIPTRGMRFTLGRKLPHIPQATTTEQQETMSHKKLLRRSYIPRMPQATADSTSYHDWTAWGRGAIKKELPTTKLHTAHATSYRTFPMPPHIPQAILQMTHQ